MRRLSLPILAALSSVMALSPFTASAQSYATTDIQVSTGAVAPVERAALDLSTLGSSSSSSASSILAASAQEQTPAQSAPVVNRPETGARPFSGIAVAVKFGLAGIGFDVATPLISQRLNLRGGASFFSYTPSTITADNLNINGNLKFQNADVMADFFPFRGRFRLSGGMTVYNDTNLNAALGVPTGQSITVGGTAYYSDPSAPLKGTGLFTFGGKTAGRVSIGTGNMLPGRGRFTFQSELGVQFFSQPTVAYTFSGEGCTDMTYTNCSAIPQANIAAEQAKLQNDLTDLRFFPVLSIGLSYRIH